MYKEKSTSWNWNKMKNMSTS